MFVQGTVQRPQKGLLPLFLAAEKPDLAAVPGIGLLALTSSCRHRVALSQLMELAHLHLNDFTQRLCGWDVSKRWAIVIHVSLDRYIINYTQFVRYSIIIYNEV